MLIGSLMLIDSSEPYMRISLSIIFAVVGATAAFFVFAVTFVIKAQRRKPTTGGEGLIGQIGTVREKLGPAGMVYVAGEYWKARSAAPLEIGTRVKVLAVEDMVLKVEKVTEEE